MASKSSHSGQVSFGHTMCDTFFNFTAGYTPLNHGSFGTFPTPVHDLQRALQSKTEARPDTFIRYTYPKHLIAARSAVAALLGAETDEVVLLPNATSGVNTILRNLEYEENDMILYFSTIYGACSKTIQSFEETTPVRSRCVGLAYPFKDNQALSSFESTVKDLRDQGHLIKAAMFDTVLTFPGARFPWEALVSACKELGVMSIVDGAHILPSHLFRIRLCIPAPRERSNRR